MFAKQSIIHKLVSIESSLRAAINAFIALSLFQPVQADEMSSSSKLTRIEIDVLRKGEGSDAYQYRVTTDQEASTPAKDIASLRARIGRLAKRDIVIIALDPMFSNEAQLREISDLRTACHDRDITFRFLDIGKHGNPFAGADVTLLAWSSPYGNPRDLENTTFFVGMKNMGNGANGFEMALKSILDRRRGRVLLAGSDYTKKSSYGQRETPFGEQNLARLGDVEWLSDITPDSVEGAK